ncbi:SpoIIE family protein phosphatase [Kitasatospora cheerisanensis]|uniref:Putative serine/threonine protein phosphatase n=1 Tax=Kitasatospora cheerisanensis KCTC 2395 TaxID=1348663 RepID=A0A066YII6_9ACTN|nr:SpoIIE family protein phosphatase [Kitasatospora cheerisanensis]KDN81293.1 putative serine/threonine protein phosphatase [Kitasatospora cheerisanensis KCTC 2395]
MRAESAAGDGSTDPLLAAAAALAVAPGALAGSLLEQLPVGVAVLDAELHWHFRNPAFRQLTGESTSEALEQPAEAATQARHVLADGRARTGTFGGRPAEFHRLRLGGAAPALLLVLPGGADVHRAELERAQGRFALLDAAVERIGSTLDPDTTCAELAAFTAPDAADLVFVDVLPLDAPDQPRPDTPRGTGTAPERLRRAATAGPTDLPARPGETVRYRPGSVAARALAEGRPIAANLLSDQELARLAPDESALADYREAGVDCLLAAPLTARGHRLGVLNLARVRGSSLGFTPDDVDLLAAVAGRAALALDHARRYARSQNTALELQRALLAEPGSPHPNLELASRYLPSGTTSVVGGDWFETVRLPFGRTLLAMGDVMGHGVEAAVDMSNYRSTLRYVAVMDLPPHRILRQLDALIADQANARPATCVLALADPARARWTFASAGHLPPALLTAEASALVDVPTGPPLGTGVGGYEQTTVELRADHALLLYTDGLVERRGEDIDVSLARLSDLRLPVDGPLDAMLDGALAALAPHAAEDDIALLAARVHHRDR